jgi:outer membrane protein assembly factor BamB
VHEISSPANATPATDGERVFVYFGAYGLVAYDFGGTVVWTKPLPASKIGYGTGASPVVSDGVVLLKMSLDDESYLLAVRCGDGEMVWKSANPSFAYGWATPIIWRENGQTVAGVFNMGQFRVYDMKTGASVWWVSGTPVQACGTPAVGDGMVYLAATGLFGNKENLIKPPEFDELLIKYDANKDGRISTDELPDSLLFVDRGISSGIGSEPLSKMLKHVKGNDQSFDRAGWIETTSMLIQEFATNRFMKTSAFAVQTGGQGDATNKIVWSESKGVPEVPSPLLYRDRLYYVKNGGLLTCRDPKSGQCLYNERIGAEGGYFASPVAADGKIYLASDRGVITVCKAGDAFKVLSRAELKESIMATPAIMEDKLYVRSAGHLWAFGQAPPADR